MLIGRGEEPVKIITTDGTEKYKACQGKRHGNIEQETCLVNHQNSAYCYKQAAENKEIEDRFQ